MASQWKSNEVGTYIETENEKYAEIISMVERRRTAEKSLKIQNVREEKTVGVRLNRTFFFYLQKRKRLWLQEICPGRVGATSQTISTRQAILHNICRHSFQIA